VVENPDRNNLYEIGNVKDDKDAIAGVFTKGGIKKHQNPTISGLRTFRWCIKCC
jgi:hypothetical protein